MTAPMTDAEKLAAIRRLCDEAARETDEWEAMHPEDRGVVYPGGNLTVDEVREILAVPSADPTPTHDADANAAWEAYREREWHGWGGAMSPDLQSAFLAGWVARPVRSASADPTPHIDRDAIVDIIEQAFFEDGVALTSAHLAADRILGLVSPVPGGIHLTPEQRAAMAATLGEHRWKDMGPDWCSCECGAVMHGDLSLREFPADEAFRGHLADALAARLEEATR